jgi:hypothetical protein
MARRRRAIICYAGPKGIPRGQHLVSGAGLEGNIRLPEAGNPPPALRNPKHLAKEAAHSAAGASRALSFVFGSRPASVKGISLPWRVS